MNLAGNPGLGDALRAAEALGCEVEALRRTGEVRVRHRAWATSTKVNVRRKDTPRELLARLRRLADHKEPDMPTTTAHPFKRGDRVTPAPGHRLHRVIFGSVGDTYTAWNGVHGADEPCCDVRWDHPGSDASRFGWTSIPAGDLAAAP